LKGVTTLEDFRKCIDDRLQALARVQGLLSRREGGLRVPFDALLREELSAHVAIDERAMAIRFRWRGRTVSRCHRPSVQTLALALHELATNAVKYGALATPKPVICVSNGVCRERDGDQRRCGSTGAKPA
jgi:two-component sensor histidine kinase